VDGKDELLIIALATEVFTRVSGECHWPWSGNMKHSSNSFGAYE